MPEVHYRLGDMTSKMGSYFCADPKFRESVSQQPTNGSVFGIACALASIEFYCEMIHKILEWSDISRVFLSSQGERFNDYGVWTTYNRSVGGGENSTHIRFQALDFKSPGAGSEQIREILRRWRGRWFPVTVGLEIYYLPTRLPRYANGHGGQLFQFVGGIGTYRTVTHLDTRGSNATWKGDWP